MRDLRPLRPASRKPTLGMWIEDTLGVISLFAGVAAICFLAYGFGF